MSSESSPILIIEDEDFIRESFQLLLELEGYSVWTADNGRHALETLREMPRPCLILLDLMMPIMNGEEFLEAKGLDESLAAIPVVVVSGVANEPELAGVTAFIPKPVDFKRLFELIRRNCGTRRKMPV